MQSFSYEVSVIALSKDDGRGYTAVEQEWPYPDELHESLEGKEGQLCTENLVWTNEDATGQRGKYRIYHERVYTNGVLVLGESAKPRLKAVEARSCQRVALIESSIETRIRIKPYLPRFVEHLSQRMKVGTSVCIFEDLRTLCDSGLQEVLRQTPREEFVAVLTVVDEEFRQCFFRNISDRAKELVSTDLQALDSVPEQFVRRAKNQMALRLQRLAETGRVSLS